MPTLRRADFQRVAEAMRDALRTVGATAIYYPEGDPARSFTIPMAKRNRAATDETAGMYTRALTLRVSGLDWQARSPARLPQRGDQIEVYDKVLVVVEAETHVAAGTFIGLEIQVTG